jgi:hypothetical protein
MMPTSLALEVLMIGKERCRLQFVVAGRQMIKGNGSATRKVQEKNTQERRRHQASCKAVSLGSFRFISCRF